MMSPKLKSISVSVTLLLLNLQEVSSFLPNPQSSLVKKCPSVTNPCIQSFRGNKILASPNQDNDDFGSIGSAGGDSYEGDVDWDAEWKKVVEKRDQPAGRPGNYKNEVERAMLKTQKATGEQLKKIKIVQPDINMRSLQSDGKVGRLRYFVKS